MSSCVCPHVCWFVCCLPVVLLRQEQVKFGRHSDSNWPSGSHFRIFIVVVLASGKFAENKLFCYSHSLSDTCVVHMCLLWPTRMERSAFNAS